MKTFTFLTVIGCLGALLPSARAFTYAGANEIFLTADVDGDGRLDAVVVDRVSGAYRIGYQLSADTYTWADARASGVQDVTSVTAGHLFSTTSDALAFTAPTGNRVNVLSAIDPSSEGQLVSLFPNGIGPNLVVSLNFTLPPMTPQDDLVASSLESIGASGNQTLFNGNGGTNLTFLNTTSLGPWLSADRVQLKEGGTDFVGAVIHTSTNDVFEALQYGPATVTVAAGDTTSVPNLFVYGRFAVPFQNQFLFFNRGASNIVLRAVQEPSPGSFNFAAPASFNLGAGIEQLFVLSGAPTRLMALVNDGADAQIYDFDGTNAPSLHQTIAAGAGESLTGAIPFGAGKFQILSGPAGSKRSTHFKQFAPSGSNYAQTGSGDLPDFNTLGMAANVFLFQQNPFVNTSAALLRQLNAADWADSAVLGLNVTVQAEKYGGVGSGLHNPTSRNLGAVPAGAAFGLVNQYFPSISLASFDPAIGNPTTDVTISPAGGPQTKAVSVSITAADPSYSILYSLDGASWNSYTGPFWVFKNTTVRYLAVVLPGGQTKTAVRSAAYSFGVPPSLADSDNDGVPDFVEIAKGLNPTKGSDSDGDGFTDLNEILAGTDPNDKSSVPTEAQRIEDFQSFDLLFAPRPFDGVSGVETNALVGINGAVHTLDGATLRTAISTNVGGAPINPAFTFTNIRAELHPSVVSVSTDPNFGINTSASDNVIGRELLGMIGTPRIARPTVNYTLGNGTLAQEASNWIVVAKAAYAAAPHVTVAGSFGVDETVSALLLERKVNELLVDRAVGGFNGTNLTLFGFRTGDRGRQPATLAQLDALSTEPDPSHPAFDLAALHSIILSNVATAPALEKLRMLSDDIYRISGLSNNAAPGRYPLPADVIRAFLITGQLSSNYATITLVSPSDQADALAAADSLLSSLGARPVATFDLTVLANSFQQGCTQLQDNSTSAMLSLFVAPGVPYKFPDSFNLAAGSIVHVHAFTDYTDPTSCTPTALQVIDATLLSSPNPPIAAGNNGDLISDAWSNFFFGGPVDPYGDADGDGVSNLQEFLDGTDPTNPLSHKIGVGPLLPAVLKLAPISLGSGQFMLSFDFPASYLNFFNFEVQETPQLDMSFGNLGGATFQNQGNGMIQVQLPAVQTDAGFFRIAMTLKP